MIIYKYAVPERNDVLKNSAIRFTQPAALNDPFETLWEFDDELRKETLKTTELLFKFRFGREMTTAELAELPNKVEEELDNMPNHFSKEIGLLSLSKRNDISLMWSHYANEHRGFVIGFDSELFQKDNKFIELREVKYSDERPIYVSPETREKGEQQLETLLLTKSNHWKYEREVRAIARLEDADNSFSIENAEYPCCLFNFPPESVKQVIFGFRMLEQERENVQQLLAEHYSGVELFEAKIKTSSFDLDILPLKPK